MTESDVNIYFSYLWCSMSKFQMFIVSCISWFMNFHIRNNWKAWRGKKELSISYASLILSSYLSIYPFCWAILLEQLSMLYISNPNNVSAYCKHITPVCDLCSACLILEKTNSFFCSSLKTPNHHFIYTRF